METIVERPRQMSRLQNLVLQAFVWIMCHAQFILFTTKSTKGSENSNSALRPKAFGRQAELRALRVLLENTCRG
jgi:hypothetical protein